MKFLEIYETLKYIEDRIGCGVSVKIAKVENMLCITMLWEDDQLLLQRCTVPWQMRINPDEEYLEWIVDDAIRLHKLATVGEE